jgi:sugar phosphate isomerase/epimerase
MFSPLTQKRVLRTRRHFLRMTSALTMGTFCAPILQAKAGTADSKVSETEAKLRFIMQIGILLGTFREPTYEAKLDAVKSCGLDCIQLSLDCVGMEAMPDQISLEMTERIRREASALTIAIASVEGTFNMSHPDAQHRQNGLSRLHVLAKACSQMGTSKIHLCTGTRDPESMWRRHPGNDSPEAWADMAACVRAAVDIAKQNSVVLVFEPEVNNVVDSAQKARRLLDEIGSPNLKVTIDAANLFHAGELPRMKEMLDEAFALLGRDIVMAHAKDLDHDGDAGHKAAGQGKLDYTRYLSLLHAYGFKGPLLLHGLSEAQVPGCIAFLREKMPS